uniref:KH domain-like protein n=1 Tax=Oryza sativa subsp. japonica TaxID=39947 RepID=Q5KQI3_ORYSJ|nr:putative KH domain-like protein [Oryza sativa Japonica Group]
MATGKVLAGQIRRRRVVRAYLIALARSRRLTTGLSFYSKPYRRSRGPRHRTEKRKRIRGENQHLSLVSPPPRLDSTRLHPRPPPRPVPSLVSSSPIRGVAGAAAAAAAIAMDGLHEIMRVSGMFRQPGVGDFERSQPASPNQMHPSHIVPNFCGNAFGPWNGMRPEGAHFFCSALSLLVLVVRPIMLLIADNHQSRDSDFNFIGRLLGPRGNSLKRIEASTGCRVFIRGKGSIKDPNKEEQLKGRAGYEHLDDPLHILIEAELPANVIDARLAKAQEILEELLKPVLRRGHEAALAAAGYGLFIRTADCSMAEAQQEVAAAAKGYRSSPFSPSSMSPTLSPPLVAAVHGGGGRAEEATTIAATATPAARSLAAGDNGMQVSGHGEHAGLSSGRRRGRPKGSRRRQILANLGQYIAVHPRALAMASGSGTGAGLPLEELGLDGAVLDALWRCAAAAVPPSSRLCSAARKKKGKRKEEREREEAMHRDAAVRRHCRR